MSRPLVSTYTSEAAEKRRLWVLRAWVTVALLLGANYVVWRWLASVNWVQRTAQSPAVARRRWV